MPERLSFCLFGDDWIHSLKDPIGKTAVLNFALSISAQQLKPIPFPDSFLRG
jgi:hypothetical protein